jgi:hypothetical protein
MKKLLIENLSETMTLVQKADFEAVDAVFEALDMAFHPDGFDDDPDERFVSLWRLFLVSVGWIEDDYWMECDFRKHHKCDACKEKEALENKDSTPAEKKPN